MTVAVVHLVANEEQSLSRFLDSYAVHAAGIEHELVLIANRWTGALSHRQRDLVAPHRLLEVRHALYDLDAYRDAARQLAATYVVFLNSYTVIQAGGWLRALVDPIASGKAAIAGTTGSYESHASSYLSAPNGPRKKLTPARLARGLVNLGRVRLQYDRFPNPHVRTSAFAIPRDVFLDIAMPPLRTKADAERMESGKRGLTREVERRGFAAVVAGRDEGIYPAGRFRESHTFRIGGQCNLLIADNRTRGYCAAAVSERRKLREITWGDASDLQCGCCRTSDER